MLSTFRVLIIIYTQITLTFISPAQISHFEFQGHFSVTKSTYSFTWKFTDQLDVACQKWTHAHPITYLIYRISCLNKWHHHLLFVSETWKSTVTLPHPSNPTQSPSPVASTTINILKNVFMVPFNYPSCHFLSKPTLRLSYVSPKDVLKS